MAAILAATGRAELARRAPRSLYQRERKGFIGDESILSEEVRQGAATWREVLANTIIYFIVVRVMRGPVAIDGIGVRRR
jgi:hypothetical protein